MLRAQSLAVMGCLGPAGDSSSYRRASKTRPDLLQSLTAGGSPSPFAERPAAGREFHELDFGSLTGKSVGLPLAADRKRASVISTQGTHASSTMPSDDE